MFVAMVTAPRMAGLGNDFGLRPVLPAVEQFQRQTLGRKALGQQFAVADRP